MLMSTQNSNLAKGQIANTYSTSDILANDQLLKAEFYKPLVVGYHNGAAVRLSDVADVVDSVQNIRNSGYVDGKPCVNLIIFRQPGANIIDTVDWIRQAMPSLKASIPAGINMTTIIDRTNYRQTVLTAFQQVEDNLAALRILSKEIGQQQVAINSSQRYLNLATERFRDGIDPYLDVISAQTTA
jgi:multidrug efflux pump subunit AcrB